MWCHRLTHLTSLIRSICEPPHSLQAVRQPPLLEDRGQMSGGRSKPDLPALSTWGAEDEPSLWEGAGSRVDQALVIESCLRHSKVRGWGWVGGYMMTTLPTMPPLVTDTDIGVTRGDG